MRVSLLLAAGVLLSAWAATAWADPASDFGVQQPTVHKQAPLFVLKNLRGGSTALRSLRGKVVLLHFWATWCPSCRHELPRIERFWRRYADQGVVLLGVNADRGDGAKVGDFMREQRLRFPVLLDPDGSVRNRYAVRALPTTYIIGRAGEIIGRMIGEREWLGSAASRWIAQTVAE